MLAVKVSLFCLEKEPDFFSQNFLVEDSKGSCLAGSESFVVFINSSANPFRRSLLIVHFFDRNRQVFGGI